MNLSTKQKRNNLVRSFLNSEELQSVNELRHELGCTMSDLIRSRLLHPNMLNINPAKLLVIFSEIGSDLAAINAALQKHFELADETYPKNGITVEALIENYLTQQHKLEVQIRKLLMRIEWRE